VRTRVRDFFRFSIRQFFVLIVCLAVCVAVNRNNRGRDLAFVAIMLLEDRDPRDLDQFRPALLLEESARPASAWELSRLDLKATVME